MSTLIAIKTTDHGAGPPYHPVLKTTGLYRHDVVVYGKRFFLSFLEHGCSRTWVDDDFARRWVKDADEIYEEIPND